MNNEDKKEFKVLMVGAAEIFNKELSNASLTVYFNALESYPILEIKNALSAHMLDTESGKFFPKPSDLVKQITGDTKQQQREMEGQAEMAWACVEGEISRIGSYANLELEDQVAIACVKSMGGWAALCSCTYDQLTWKKKEFMSMYDTYSRTPLEHLPKRLPGLEELHNKGTEEKQALDNLSKVLEGYKNRITLEKEQSKLEIKQCGN